MHIILSLGGVEFQFFSLILSDTDHQNDITDYQIDILCKKRELVSHEFVLYYIVYIPSNHSDCYC